MAATSRRANTYVLAGSVILFFLDSLRFLSASESNPPVPRNSRRLSKRTINNLLGFISDQALSPSSLTVRIYSDTLPKALPRCAITLSNKDREISAHRTRDPEMLKSLSIGIALVFVAIGSITTSDNSPAFHARTSLQPNVTNYRGKYYPL